MCRWPPRSFPDMSKDLDEDRALCINAVRLDFDIAHQEHDALGQRSPQRLAEGIQNDPLGRDLHTGVAGVQRRRSGFVGSHGRPGYEVDRKQTPAATSVKRFEMPSSSSGPSGSLACLQPSA